MLELLLNMQPLGDASLEEGALVEFACLPPPECRLQLEVGGVLLEPFLRPADPYWRWRWVAPDRAGGQRLVLAYECAGRWTIDRQTLVQVLPRKLDQDRYRALLADLEACEPRLIQALGGGLHPAARSDQRPPEGLEELLGLFDLPLAQLLAAVTRLSQRPPDRLRAVSRPTPPDQVRDLSRLDLRDLPASNLPLPLAAHLAAAGPLAEQRSLPSYDSYEHRLLLRLLDVLLRRIGHFGRQHNLGAALQKQLSEAQTQLRALRNAPFLADLAPLDRFRGPSVRLQRDADWRVVYRFWQALRRRPLIAWDTPSEEVALSDLPRLYERWCLVQLALTLAAWPGWTLEAQTLTDPAADSFDWQLALHSRAPLLTLRSAQGLIHLWYQPRYRAGRSAELVSLDRHTRVPDLVIEQRYADRPPHLLILDAKYRLDARGGVPADALADAYSYLGGIGTASGERAVGAVALLYPGNAVAAIYPSGVAVLPLLPAAVDSLTEWLRDLIPDA